MVDILTGSVEDVVSRVFAPGGPLVAAGLEVRESQKALSLAIARRIDAGKGWTLGEAPCGTGKGFAYLLPGIVAALRAEKKPPHEVAATPWKFPKVVVSTANITLQSQLIQKDIPAVAKLLGVEVRSLLLKGRANYLCRSKLQEVGAFAGWEVRRLMDWSREPTCTGDRDDLTWDAGRAWSEVSVQSKDCHGKKCPFYNPSRDDVPLCFSQKAREQKGSVHVVVLNHYLLPIYQPIPAILLAVDEAHELEECVRKAISRTLKRGSGKYMAGKVGKALNDPNLGRTLVEEPIEELFDILETWLQNRDGGQSWVSLPLAPGWHRGHVKADVIDRIKQAAGEITRAADKTPDTDTAGKLEKLAGQVYDLWTRAKMVETAMPTQEIGDEMPGAWAIWIDRKIFGGEAKISCGIAPVDVAPGTIRLQRAYPAAVLTSATLAVNRDLGYARSTLGMARPGTSPRISVIKDASGHDYPLQTEASPPVEELILPSPYPLKEMGLLVLPANAPNPKTPQWEKWALDQVVEVVKQAKGRTLVLSSSTKNVGRYGYALQEKTDYPVRIQGEMGRGELIRWFRDTTEGVLVATRSFFQGLDVQGESCSCVVIDRIPFDPPGDPLEEAVGVMLMERAGQSSPFYARSLPKASMVLAQAAGRLIRSLSDRGALVLLDDRVNGAAMMARVLRGSLPPFSTSDQVADVGRFLEGEPLEGLLHPQGPLFQGQGAANTPAVSSGMTVRRRRQ